MEFNVVAHNETYDFTEKNDEIFYETSSKEGPLDFLNL